MTGGAWPGWEIPKLTLFVFVLKCSYWLKTREWRVLEEEQEGNCFNSCFLDAQSLSILMLPFTRYFLEQGLHKVLRSLSDEQRWKGLFPLPIQLPSEVPGGL